MCDYDPPDLFNLHEGERRKAEGMEIAYRNAMNGDHRSLFLYARDRLKAAARTRHSRQATADDWFFYCLNRGWNPDVLGPASGSLFKDGDWEPVMIGDQHREIRSKRPKNHARMVKVWRLK